MSEVLDKFFGINARALNVWTQRSELLAGNIANADTPHYKAKDIDFDSILKSSAENLVAPVTLEATQTGHFGYENSRVIGATKYRVPLQSSLDGNTVDSQVEHALFAENAIRHQISLQLLSNKINGLVKTLRSE